MHGGVEGDISNMAVLKSSLNQDYSALPGPMPLDDSGAWEQRSEDVHVLDMERKPRRKSYGYHIRSAPVSADDDDLAGLPGISKIDSSEDEDDEDEEERGEGGERGEGANMDITDESNPGRFETEVAERRNSYRAVDPIYVNPPPHADEGDDDANRIPPKRASLMQDPVLVFDELAQEHAATVIQAQMRGHMTRRSVDWKSSKAEKTKRSKPYTT
ncbi:uncharacterized protein LOC142356507 [Convolutriloba macropyga]|uniref:uncharacterized protein LOC142356507 n=1 Tax=Convolutriloba macropyga TaxID=536237 RepID=UPI003F5248CD